MDTLHISLLMSKVRSCVIFQVCDQALTDGCHILCFLN